jgi:hypothetical protein
VFNWWHSDYQGPIPSGTVRITSGFEQTQGFFLRGLSESPLHSDYQGPIPSVSVRITSGFGLSKANSFVDCPNYLWIWTIQGLFIRVCPNHLWIWTTKGYFFRGLSESPLHLDYQELFLSWSVRITSAFGQTQGFFLRGLSESPLDSDYQRLIPSGPVRITQSPRESLLI